MVQVFEGRQIEYTGSILTGTPPSRINSGIAPSDQVAVIQLEQLKGSLTNLIVNAEATQRAGDDALNAQLQQAINQVNQRLTAAVEGVRDRIVVSAMVGSAEEVAPTVPGIDPAATDGYSNLILVYDPANPADNGIYLPNGSRDPRFPTTDAFQNGQLIFVDAGTAANSHWYVSDEPTATALPLQPFGRVQDLGVNPATFLTLTANRLTAHVNSEFFRVLSIDGVNSLDFSQAFIDWRNGVDRNLDTLRDDVTSVQQLNESQQQSIASIQAKDLAQDAEISSLNSQVTQIEQVNEAQNTAIAGVQQVNEAQNTAIQGLQTEVATKTTLTEAEAAFLALFQRYNPIKTLTNRVVASIPVSGTDPNTGAAVNYNIITTTFTIELGERDFRLTELSEALAPYQSVRKPEISYPGTQSILKFYTREPANPASPQPGEGPVPNDSFEAWFHKGFRLGSTPTPPPPVQSAQTVQQATGVKITGTPFGTEGFHGNNPQNSYASVFDGNPETFFDSNTSSGAICGLNFGSVKQVRKIRYLARRENDTTADRIIGGRFEFSSDGINYVNAHTVPTGINTRDWQEVEVNVSAQYGRYVSPERGYGNIAEIEFYS
jgi:hypothetical protein